MQSKGNIPTSRLGPEVIPKKVDNSILYLLPKEGDALSRSDQIVVDMKENIFAGPVESMVSMGIMPAMDNNLNRAYEQNLIAAGEYKDTRGSLLAMESTILKEMRKISDAQVDYKLGIPLYDENPDNDTDQRRACKAIIEVAMSNIEGLFSGSNVDNLEIEARKFALTCAKESAKCVEVGVFHELKPHKLWQDKSSSGEKNFGPRR